MKPLKSDPVPFAKWNFERKLAAKWEQWFYRKVNLSFENSYLSELSPSMTTGSRLQVNVSLTYGSHGGDRPGKSFFYFEIKLFWHFFCLNVCAGSVRLNHVNFLSYVRERRTNLGLQYFWEENVTFHVVVSLLYIPYYCTFYITFGE